MNKIFVFIFVIFLFSCSERKQDNPFDPSGETPIHLSAYSISERVDLSWNSPDIIDYTGFNIYRKNESSGGPFTRIGEVSRLFRNYTDTTISYGNTYIYYVKVASGHLESLPSRAVSVTPGPGFNWIVDDYSYSAPFFHSGCSSCS